jgi:hypothetical protein
MPLHIQDPEDPLSPYLLETLLTACTDAAAGGGAFAWSTSRGARLLIEDPTFTAFVGEHPFDLIVGVDSITDQNAIKTLIELAGRTPKLTIRIFLHERTGALFHPKYCWFRTGTGGVIVTGSGNLTVGGLRANWEAFSVETLTGADTRVLELQWDAWCRRHDARLLSPDDERVLERASKNAGWTKAARPKADAASAPLTRSVEHVPPDEPDDPAPQSVLRASVVLVAEIPRAGDRWSQANFDLDNYEAFFGARVGSQRRVLLQHVTATGGVGDIESRPSVEVRSQNYRFELEAAKNRSYPAGGPPIGVFLRLPTGLIRYLLLMPGEAAYSTAASFLTTHWHGRRDRMRRVRVPADVLREQWPDTPLWRIETDEE